MQDLLVALCLVLVIEGALYALMPERMQQMMLRLLETPTATLRWVGLVVALLGGAGVWAVRG